MNKGQRTASETEDIVRGRMKWAGSVSAFAVGLGIGAALGVLFAPRSGSDTRDLVIERAQDGWDGAIASGQALTERAQDGIDQVKGHVRQAAKVGQRAYREAKSSSC